MIEKNPLNMENNKEKKDQDLDVQQSATRHPEWYSPNDDPSNWKITLPN
jgi:hypothetical protein